MTAAALVVVATTACAIRLGGPAPVEMVITAAQAGDATDSGEPAGLLATAGARAALLVAPRDSTWFASVAAQSGLELSGPGPAGTASLGFLYRDMELLGDTTIALGVASGGQIFLHDALFRMEDDRLLDLLLARMLPGVGVQEGVRSLLSYIATEVGDEAGIVLALDAPDSAAADSAATMVLAYLENARVCADTDGGESGGLRLFYGPGARIRCLSAGVERARGVTAISARVVVGR